MLKSLHGLLARDLELERLAGALVVDGHRDDVVLGLPQQRDLDPPCLRWASSRFFSWMIVMPLLIRASTERGSETAGFVRIS